MAIRKLATDFVALTANTNESIDEIAALANGSMIVTSHYTSASGALKYVSRLYSSTYAFVGTPQNLNNSAYTTAVATKITKVLDAGDGTYWVLWNAPPQSGSSVPSIMSQHFAADGTKLGTAARQSIFDGQSKTLPHSIAATGDPLKPFEWASVKTDNGITTLKLTTLDANFVALGSDIILTENLAADTIITGIKAISADKFLVSYVENKSTATADQLSVAIADLTTGTFAPSTVVTTGTIKDAEIDVNSNGTFAVTMRIADATAPNGIKIIASYYSAAGELQWTANTITRAEAVYGADYETVVLNNGRIAALWVTADHVDPKKTVLFLQYFGADGESLTDEILVGYVPRQSAGINLHAELNAAGKLVVNWLGMNGTLPVKHSAVFDPYRFAATTGNDIWHGANTAETFRGARGNDDLYGQGGADSLYGDEGNDYLEGGDGADRIDGGLGEDTASYYNGDAVSVSLLNPATSTGAATGDTFFSIERLKGSNSGGDILEGNRINNWIWGYGGNDILLGGDGNDVLFGGAGADGLDGQNGEDWVSYFDDSAVKASLLLSAGQSGAAFGDVYIGIENLEGSNRGNDTLTGDGNFNKISGGGGNDVILGLGGIDELQGGSGSDKLLGGDDGDELDGNSGDDKLYGDKGDDTLFGGTGADYLNGGAGFDFADYRGGTSAIVSLSGSFTNAGAAKGDTFTSIEGVYGTSKGADKISGNSANNDLFGFGGDDKLYGLGGNDYLQGGTGADVLDGSSGTDTAGYYNDVGVTVALDGSVTNKGAAATDTLISIENLDGSNRFADFLIGSAIGNYIWGNGGADRLVGRGGNDGLNGGVGKDILEGGAGKDYFVYSKIADHGDKILDFEKSEYFSFNSSEFGFSGSGTLPNKYFVKGLSITDFPLVIGGSPQFFYRTTDDTLWFRNGGPASMIADLDIAFDLTAANIYIY